MPKNRLFLTLAVLPLVGLAACGGGEPEADAEATAAEGVVTDTLVNQDTTLAPVVTPVTTAESAAVVVDADTAIDVARDTVPLNPPRP
jgi:ABC-type Fe3+-hydroxamate transport system substrate-binding protein